MKLKIYFILVVLWILSTISCAFANGYTLPEKMDRQIQIGSGLKGSFVIHGNADETNHPFLKSIQNAEYEIRGILHEGDIHYYIYQAGDQDQLNALTEFCRIGGKDYFRSDLLEGHPYLLPTDEEVLSAMFQIGSTENPSILPQILRIAIQKNDGTNENKVSLDKLEKQIEMWLSGFAAETTFQSSEDSAPRLSLQFRIPVEALYQQIAGMASSLSQDENLMSILTQNLPDDATGIYANASLGNFYLDALKQLSMTGEIVFSKTVSTMGEPVSARLSLPLDEGITGFSQIVIQNDEHINRYTVSGEKGIYSIEIPADFNPDEKEYEKEFRFIRVHADNSGKEKMNLAMRIILRKTYQEYEEADGPRTHEISFYTIRALRDVSSLPDGITPEMIPEADEINSELELHFSSKLELSSPTTLDLSFRFSRQHHEYELTGKIKTASPWEFVPFKTENAAKIDNLSPETLKPLLDLWKKNADIKIERIPLEISLPEETPASSAP